MLLLFQEVMSCLFCLPFYFSCYLRKASSIAYKASSIFRSSSSPPGIMLEFFEMTVLQYPFSLSRGAYTWSVKRSLSSVDKSHFRFLKKSSIKIIRPSLYLIELFELSKYCQYSFGLFRLKYFNSFGS